MAHKRGITCTALIYIAQWASNSGRIAGYTDEQENDAPR